MKIQTYINVAHEGRIRLRMLLKGHLICLISGSVGRIQLRLQFQKGCRNLAMQEQMLEKG